MNTSRGPIGALGEASGSEGPTEGLLGSLLDHSHYIAPAELPGLVARTAAQAGLHDAVIYLVDYEQTHLVPLAGEHVPQRETLLVDQNFGGRAFRTVQAMASELEDGDLRVWLPLLDGAARLGVLEVRVDTLDGPTARRCRQLSALIALLIATKDRYTDLFPVARRTKPLSLAAEMQWSLLPPLTFSNGHVTVSGALEPSYRIAGDSFDYALDEDITHVAIIDAMGHGFEAATMAAVSVSVYRHARRHGFDLTETYAAMNDVIAHQFEGDRFATAQIATLDNHRGTLRWVNAGHPPPWLVRGTNVLGPQYCAPSLPLGLGDQVEEVNEISLEPGDRLLFMSDGVLEARSSTGEFFGEGPLPDVLVRAVSSGLPSPEALRRLLRTVVDHHSRHLDDDATTVFVDWHGRERRDPYTSG